MTSQETIEEQTAAGPATAERKTILVVEDEPLVLSFLRAVLEDLGYEVFEAASAESALEIWRNQAPSIDLLFTDIFMPGMNGAELARVLQAAQPDLRIVYTSGAPRHRVDALVKPVRDIHFVPKPYHLPSLEETLKKAVEGVNQ